MGKWIDRHALQAAAAFVVVTLGTAAVITTKMVRDLRKTKKK